MSLVLWVSRNLNDIISTIFIYFKDNDDGIVENNDDDDEIMMRQWDNQWNQAMFCSFCRFSGSLFWYVSVRQNTKYDDI